MRVCVYSKLKMYVPNTGLSVATWSGRSGDIMGVWSHFYRSY